MKRFLFPAGGLITLALVAVVWGQFSFAGDTTVARVKLPPAADLPKSITVTTFARTTLDDGTEGQPVPVTLTASSSSSDAAQAVLRRISGGKTTAQKMDVILEKLNRIEKRLESTRNLK